MAYKHKKLTVDQLRKHEGYKSLSDNEAKEVLDTLLKLTLITHEIVLRKNS